MFLVFGITYLVFGSLCPWNLWQWSVAPQNDSRWCFYLYLELRILYLGLWILYLGFCIWNYVFCIWDCVFCIWDIMSLVFVIECNDCGLVISSSFINFKVNEEATHHGDILQVVDWYSIHLNVQLIWMFQMNIPYVKMFSYQVECSAHMNVPNEHSIYKNVQLPGWLWRGVPQTCPQVHECFSLVKKIHLTKVFI